MKIVRRKIQRAGADVVVAFIDTEGIDLGIDVVPLDTPPSIEEQSEYRQRPNALFEDEELDLEAEDEPLLEAPTPVLTENGALNLNNIYFSINTFKKLTNNPAEMWDSLFHISDIPRRGILR